MIGWIRGQGRLREVKIRLVPLYFGFRGSLEFSFYRVELTLMSIFRVSFVAFMVEDTWILSSSYLHKILKYFQI